MSIEVFEEILQDMRKGASAVAKPKFGVIGVGLHGENHAILYADDNRSELAVVCDMNEERGRAVAEKYGCEYTTDYLEVAASDVDAVSVATPDFAHYEPAKAMMKAGKHVLLEKPLATDVSQARELVRTAEECGVTFMVNFSNRWNPKYVAVKESLLSGELGRPVMGFSRLANPLSVPEGMLAWSTRSGPEWFLFPHTLDVVRWLLEEEPVEVFARGRKEILVSRGIDAYDAIQASIQFESAFVTFETSWILPNSWPAVASHRFDLIATEGRVDVETDYNGIHLGSAGGFRYQGVAPLARRNYYGKLVGPHFDSVRHFVECVGQGKESSVTGRDGLINTLLIAAIVESVEKKAPVSLKMPS